MNERHALLSILVVLLGLFWVSPVMADIPTMTVSEIEPGMQGIGRTVILGTEIEEFDIEVIDIFTNLGYDGGPLILMRMSGDVIDASGGIAGGYSGSPVYIDGKLIGALSWGPWFTEGDVAAATPIHNMLRAFTYDDEPGERISDVPICLDEPIQVAGRTFDSVMLADSTSAAIELENTWGENTLVMTPARTPLVVSGLSEAGFDRLSEFAGERLPYMDLVMGPGGGAVEGVPILIGPTILEPGASIGAQLATGDLDLTAVGTLTWVDDSGRFLAFGHPFLQDGPTNLPFVTTKIVYTMPALDRSYKLGEPLEVVGTCTQDRSTAIGGQLREIPDMVDFSLVVTDYDTDRTRRYNYSVINKEEWLPLLGWLMPMEGLTYTTDRIGSGTCRVSFAIWGEGLAEPIERENLIYAGFDVASQSLNEFMEALYIPTLMNPYREVKITRVEIEVEITSARQTMDIVRARFNNAPNMGPGAVGYQGPEDEDTETVEDEELFEDSEWNEEEYGETQDGSLEDEMEMFADEFMMDSYDMEYQATELVGYYPGDTVEVLVTLRPWRDKLVEEIIEIEIPKDYPTGQTSIDIQGGSSFFYGMFGGGMGYYTDAGVYMPPEDLDEIIEAFVERDVNNSIIATLGWIATGEEDPYFYLWDELEFEDPVQSTLITEDIIYGWFSLPIEILSDEEELVEENYDEEMYEYDSELMYGDGSGSSDSGNPHRN